MGKTRKPAWMVYLCPKDQDSNEAARLVEKIACAVNFAAPISYFTKDKGRWEDHTRKMSNGEVWHVWWFVPDRGDYYYQFSEIDENN